MLFLLANNYTTNTIYLTIRNDDSHRLVRPRSLWKSFYYINITDLYLYKFL